MTAPESRDRGDRWVAVAALVAASVVLAIYVLRVDEVVGSYVDDGWYVLLAKALASGHGFTLLNTPTPGIRPLYPPGFPLVLSVVFRVFPTFPDNLPALKAVSVAAMMGAGVLAWLHCRRVRGLPAALAFGVAVATVLHPAFVFLATATVLSECVFTCIQLAAILATERALRRGAAPGWTLAGGALSGFAMLVRGFGATNVVAGAVLLVRRWRWRGLAWFLAGTLLVLLPWQVDGWRHPTTPAQQLEANDYVVFGYGTHFWKRWAGQAQYGDETWGDLPGRVWRCARRLFRIDGGAVLLYPPYRQIEPGVMPFPIAPWAYDASMALVTLTGVGLMVEMRRRVGVAELVVVGTSVLALIWPWVPFRFFLPLLPFLLCYLLAALRAIGRLLRATPGVPALAAVLAVLIAVSLQADVEYLRAVRGPAETRPAWNRGFAEQVQLVHWIAENTRPDEVIAASMPGFVHLFSGRRTVGRWNGDRSMATWRDLGVRYLALLDFSAQPVPDNILPQLVAYRTRPTNLRVIDVGMITGVGR